MAEEKIYIFDKLGNEKNLKKEIKNHLEKMVNVILNCVLFGLDSGIRLDERCVVSAHFVALGVQRPLAGTAEQLWNSIACTRGPILCLWIPTLD